LAPIVHGLEAEYYDRINFVYLDIDDPTNETFKDILGFRYQPQLILLDGNGQILYQWIGPIPREEFVLAFEDVLAR
jgi:thioredoxin-related protein